MRVLCTCMPQYGHFHPMVPLARALADAGHEVAFATASAFHPEIAAAGFTALAAGIDARRVEDECRRRFADAADVPAESQRRRMATDIAPAHMLPDLLRHITAWEADVIINEEGEYSAPLAATIAGISHVTHSWPAPLIPSDRAQRIADALAPLWRRWGVEPAPLGGFYRHLYLDCCPPPLQRPHAGGIGVVRPLRPVGHDLVHQHRVPAWLERPSGRPTVYVTLGTVPAFNRAPGIFAVVLDALRDEPLNLIVTVGPNNDPASLGPQPAHVHIERYVPQSLLLPHCDVVVCHGGASTTAAALAHGLPVLVLPRGGASQQRNADACVANGVGRTVAAPDVRAPVVRATVRALLDAPRYRQAARRIAAAIRRMPGPQELVQTLEELVARNARRRGLARVQSDARRAVACDCAGLDGTLHR